MAASGANQINGISFDISDRKKAEDEARRRAVKALQDKAELYATATGLHIQRLARLSAAAVLLFLAACAPLPPGEVAQPPAPAALWVQADADGAWSIRAVTAAACLTASGLSNAFVRASQ